MNYSLLISGFSLIVAIIALIVSFKASSKSNSIAMGEIELSIHEAISNSEARVSENTIKMLPLLHKKDKSDEEKKQLEVYEKVFAQAIEDNLNSYDQACSKYLDKKVDKERFRRTYRTPIRRLIQESPQLDKYFDRNKTHYHAILKVYDEWENLEK